MSSTRIGSSIYHIDSCPNSMDAAKEHLESLSHGIILSIKNLTAARGRQGRVWTLDPGQLVMTFVLKPKQFLVDRPDALHFLFMAISLAICKPLQRYGAGLKWPNDIILCNKKLAGILMESVWQSEKLRGLVIGFAVNVNNQFAVDHELFTVATSLRDVVEHEFDLKLLEQEVLQSLNHFYDLWAAGKFIDLFYAWRDAQILMGKSIKVHHTNGTVVEGVMHDLKINGDLVLKDSEGILHSILYAQVFSVIPAASGVALPVL